MSLAKLTVRSENLLSTIRLHLVEISKCAILFIVKYKTIFSRYLILIVAYLYLQDDLDLIFVSFEPFLVSMTQNVSVVDFTIIVEHFILPGFQVCLNFLSKLLKDYLELNPQCIF